ncbi:hypothetical protein LZ31DRAFT_539348 [Colletotrichum somersetense]|nr:hypothetical protein LZ31DRAFT_539348 [Colletotrichum somersetense]
MRLLALIGGLSAAAVASAGVMAFDMSEEMRMGWKMGLLPREDSQNLQPFDGSLGGLKASAVRYLVLSPNQDLVFPCFPFFIFFFRSLAAGGIVGPGLPRVRSDVRLSQGRGWRGFSPNKHDQMRNQDEGTKFLADFGAREQITKSSNSGRPFEVDGDTFPDFATAANRACDNQKNKCADAANSGSQNFKVSDCDKQSGKLVSV